MIKYKDYVASWLSSSVDEFVKIMPHTSSGMKFALVTCLDSEEPAKLSKSAELKALRDRHLVTRVGGGLLIPTNALHDQILSKTIFFGFDEVFFFPEPVSTPKPKSAWIVGPGRISQETMDRLGEWMSANACSLAVGDGDGLNVIVKAKGLVRVLLGYVGEIPAHQSRFVEQSLHPT